MTEKPKPETDEKGRFLPGKTGNPAGRPKGSRNKLGEAFLADLLVDWEENGVAAIQTMREEKPAEYVKVVASILPKDMNININEFDGLSDEQLIERVRELDRLLKPFLDDEGSNEDRSGAEAPTRH